MHILSLPRTLAWTGCACLCCLTSAAETDAERIQKLETEVGELRQQVAELKAMVTRGTAAPVATNAALVAASTNGCFESLAADLSDGTSLYDTVKSSVNSVIPEVAPGKKVELDMSVVLDTYFYHDSYSDAGSLPGRMAGFDSGDGDDPRNGFNLREVELGLSAAVDPYFRAWTTVSIEEDGAGFEEAVIQTTCLPYGFTLSAGKLKSGIGRLNRQHSHVWDFVDTPLVYRAMFGDEGLSDAGAQLTWLAPTPFYLLFGTEAFNGDNDASFAVRDEMTEYDAPRLGTAFLKVGPDLGPQHALQAGLSALYGRHSVWDSELGGGASGTSQIYGGDLVYKYSANRSHGEGDAILQGEYFYRRQDLGETRGEWSDDTAWRALQDGYYFQGLYGFAPRWRGGLRLDEVGLLNDLDTPAACGSEGPSYRLSAVTEWRFSEFSLLRFQAGRGWYATDDGRLDDWIFALEWQVSFGQHPAHDF